jgi:hypothetical protein
MPLAVGLAILAGSSLVIGLAAAAGIAAILFCHLKDPADVTGHLPGRLPGWLLAAWYVGLFLTTPLYTPYPRLTLPWLMASWLGAGMAIGALIGHDENPGQAQVESADSADRAPAGDNLNDPPPASQRSAVALLLVALIIAGAGLEWFMAHRGVPGWEPRTGMADAAPAIMKAIQGVPSLAGQNDLESFVVYTYGEPAALFQLRLAGVRWVRPVKDLEMPPSRLPTFVLCGPQALRMPGFPEQLAGRGDRLHLVARIPYRRSRLVTLDEARSHESPEAALEIYEVR